MKEYFKMNGILIVGCGAIALMHARIIRKLLGKDLPFVVVSRRKCQLLAFQKKVGGKMRLIEEKDFRLETKLPEVAIIACLPQAHLCWIQRLTPHCKKILVEKPAITSSSELIALDDWLLHHPHLKLMVAENYDFKPSLIKLQERLSSVHLGKLKKIYLRKEFKQPAKTWKNYCGALFEGGIHYVALAQTLAQSEANLESLKILAWRKNTLKVERGSQIEWECKNGVKVELLYAWDRFSPTFGIGQTFYIELENGRVEFESNGLWIAREGLFLQDISGSTSMIKAFITLPEDAIDFKSSWKKAKRDLEIVFNAYERAGCLPCVSVSTNKAG
jgi:predicted dehydrogenase